MTHWCTLHIIDRLSLPGLVNAASFLFVNVYYNVQTADGSTLRYPDSSFRGGVSLSREIPEPCV